MTHCPCHARAARADSDEVLVSAYRRRGDALLIVSNFLGHEERTVTLQPHPERLRLGAELEVRDLLSGGAILVRDGAIKPALQEGQARYAGPVAPTCQWTAEDDAGSFDDDTVGEPEWTTPLVPRQEGHGAVATPCREILRRRGRSRRRKSR